MKNNIKLFDPHYGKAEEKAILKVLKSGYWASGSGLGNVENFERNVKKYLKSKNCIAVNSGTAALNLALSLIDIKNKEVILPSLTFVSTAHAIKVNGGIPKFVDVDSKSLCIDTNKIEAAITKKTRAILPVHFGGTPCNLDKIISLCKKFNLELVEDAAHAIGTTYRNKKIGTHGIAVCFSFHPVKNLAMPMGGLISINHPNHKKLRTILEARRWSGITNRKDTDYDIKELGWNYYMNELSTAIGLVQLKNSAKPGVLWREILLLVKYRKKNLLTPLFWFFSIGCLIIPRRILIWLVDTYKLRVNSKLLGSIEFNYIS